MTSPVLHTPRVSNRECALTAELCTGVVSRLGEGSAARLVVGLGRGWVARLYYGVLAVNGDRRLRGWSAVTGAGIAPMISCNEIARFHVEGTPVEGLDVEGMFPHLRVLVLGALAGPNAEMRALFASLRERSARQPFLSLVLRSGCRWLAMCPALKRLRVHMTAAWPASSCAQPVRAECVEAVDCDSPPPPRSICGVRKLRLVGAEPANMLEGWLAACEAEPRAFRELALARRPLKPNEVRPPFRLAEMEIVALPRSTRILRVWDGSATGGRVMGTVRRVFREPLKLLWVAQKHGTPSTYPSQTVLDHPTFVMLPPAPGAQDERQEGLASRAFPKAGE